MENTSFGNVLVVGNSGVGKSTLINAVLGEEAAETNWGAAGTTKQLRRYTSDEIPFGLIDTVGFEPGREMTAIKAVLDWTKRMAKEGTDNGINVIWFCIDGTAGKLFPKALESYAKAVRHWKSVPVIIVITKSYSVPDRVRNTDMVHNALAMQTKYPVNVKKVIPVVAKTYALNETAFAPPEGITELLEYTNALMPEGLEKGGEELRRYTLNRKRIMAQSVIGGSVAAAVAVAAVPIPFADHLLLVPIEVMLISSIARIYKVKQNSGFDKVKQLLTEAGAATLAGHAAVDALKAIPGIQLGAAVINMIVAGGIVAAIGEATVLIFEAVSTGEKNLDDLEWVRDILAQSFGGSFLERIKSAGKNADGKTGKGRVTKLITDLFAPKQAHTEEKGAEE